MGKFTSRASLVLVTGTLFFSITTLADERFQIGMEKAKICATCHGDNGISSIESYPNLQGQKMGYLMTALRSYQTRERSGGLAVLMQQQADALSEQDIADIAYYYSKLGSDANKQ